MRTRSNPGRSRFKSKTACTSGSRSKLISRVRLVLGFSLMLKADFTTAQSLEQIDLNLQQKLKVKPLLAAHVRVQSAVDTKQWRNCVRLATDALKASRDLKGWTYLVGLQCLESETELKVSPALSYLVIADQEGLLESQSAARTILESAWTKQVFRLLQLPTQSWTQKDRELFWKHFSWLESQVNRLGAATELPLGFWKKAVELASSTTQSERVAHLKQRLAEFEGSAPAQVSKGDESQTNPERVKSAASPGLKTSSEEEKLIQQFESAAAKTNFIAAVETYLALSESAPGSGSMTKASTRMQSLLVQLYELEAEDSKPVKSAVLKVLKKLDVERLFDLGRFFYNRGLFTESATYLAIWWDLNRQNPYIQAKAVKSYELVSDAALAAGDHDLQKQVNEFVIEKFPGTLSARLAAFRLGTLNIRKGSWLDSVIHFEACLDLASKDGLDLQGRYWLWRSLDKAGQSDRAIQVRESLIVNYPFSYYGLRALADRDQGRLKWKGASEKEQKRVDAQTKSAKDTAYRFWGTRLERETVNRIADLQSLGWHEFIGYELASLPEPTTPDARARYAIQLAAAKQYSKASYFANLAWDEDQSLRTFELIEAAWPSPFWSSIQKAAQKNGLEPYLVQALTKQESAFHPKAISSSKAIGLMQMIPPTAKEIAQDLNLGTLQLPTDLYDFDRNIQMGTHYLAKMVKQFNGSVPLGVASYNAGPTRMKKWLQSRTDLKSQNWVSSDPIYELWIDEIPYSETRFYVKAILRNLLMYRLLNQKVNDEGVKSMTLDFSQPLWINSAQAANASK